MSMTGIFVKTNPNDKKTKNKKTIATLFISMGKTVFCINGDYCLDSFYVDGAVTSNMESW